MKALNPANKTTINFVDKSKGHFDTEKPGNDKISHF